MAPLPPRPPAVPALVTRRKTCSVRASCLRSVCHVFSPDGSFISSKNRFLFHSFSEQMCLQDHFFNLAKVRLSNKQTRQQHHRRVRILVANWQVPFPPPTPPPQPRNLTSPLASSQRCHVIYVLTINFQLFSQNGWRRRYRLQALEHSHSLIRRPSLDRNR